MGKNYTEIDSNTINLLSTGTTINGDITSNSDIRIDGILTGNLSTKGRLVIGESGKIKGEIICKNADISGVVEGKILAAELLSLKATSVITGDIVIGKLAVEPGCLFNGTCKIDDSTNKTNDNKIG